MRRAPYRTGAKSPEKWNGGVDGLAAWVAQFEAHSFRFAAEVFAEIGKPELADAYHAEAERVERAARGKEHVHAVA